MLCNRNSMTKNASDVKRKHGGLGVAPMKRALKSKIKREKIKAGKKESKRSDSDGG